MTLIYQLDIKDSENRSDIDVSDLSEYQLYVLDQYLKNKEIIDKKIENALEGWKMSSIARVELAILRLSLCEIIYVDDVPYKVAINEAIEIAKLYADEKAPSFINGVIKKCLNDIDIK